MTWHLRSHSCTGATCPRGPAWGLSRLVSLLLSRVTWLGACVHACRVCLCVCGRQACTKALPRAQVFPNWCTHLDEQPGDCGCAGPPPSLPLPATFVNFTLNEEGHLDHGVLECPKEAVQGWFIYHVPCSASSREKIAVLEMVQTLADRVNAARSDQNRRPLKHRSRVLKQAPP